jgi:hypothetical protein
MHRMQEMAFPGFKFQKFSWGEYAPDLPRDSCVVCRPHRKVPFQKISPPPTGKSLKRALHVGNNMVSSAIWKKHARVNFIYQNCTSPKDEYNLKSLKNSRVYVFLKFQE